MNRSSILMSSPRSGQNMRSDVHRTATTSGAAASRRLIALFVWLLALVGNSSQVSAQTWPARPITIVVPFSAGTTSDVVGRALAEHVSKAIGQPIIVDNRGGAGGNLGASTVARAAPDGYTLLLATTGQAATNQLMYKNPGFEPARDFSDIVLVGKSPVIIVAGANGPVKSLKQLIEYAKVNPDKLTAGFPGNGTLGHITGKLLQDRAQIKFGEVQYRGSVGIITDLLGGHVDLGMDSMAAYVANVQDGKLRALGIASKGRFAGLPDVPTVSEGGLLDFEASVWYAVLAPAGTPPEIVKKLNAATNDFLHAGQTKELFEKLGIEAAGGTPEDLKAFIDTEVKKWAPIIKSANISF
jgi:tripartite-type tricarboxylate transporter receptor subunit TctC